VKPPRHRFGPALGPLFFGSPSVLKYLCDNLCGAPPRIPEAIPGNGSLCVRPIILLWKGLLLLNSLDLENR